MGIYDDCDLQGPVILQCPCVEPGDIDVYLNGLTVGQTYYFFIDGCSGTRCTYWIEIIYGGGTPTVLGPENVVCGSEFPDCQDICVGADVTFIMEDVFNASHYVWNINGNEIETDDPQVTTQFDAEGTYNICAYGYNDCNQGSHFVLMFQSPCFLLKIWEVLKYAKMTFLRDMNPGLAWRTSHY